MVVWPRLKQQEIVFSLSCVVIPKLESGAQLLLYGAKPLLVSG